jgi:hypothetical protein
MARGAAKTGGLNTAIRGNGELQEHHPLHIQTLGHAGVFFLPLQQTADLPKITL